MGKIVAALRRIGFDEVYDTSTAADLTVIGGVGGISRQTGEGRGAAAVYLLLSGVGKLLRKETSRAAFGCLKLSLPDADVRVSAQEINKQSRKSSSIVAVMPCTAKKFEAQRPEFAMDGVPNVDAVITTQGLIRMIKEAGVIFDEA